ncbi:hypothetical protein TVAG_469220 [Trichomonas vaginalis G3]|uniref:Uncharacterized protein n=1 Tax=Trichomonas vaginalis (strain ATCC PRA-98 / G3) TaxID=412133 RepID=A2FD92_TRIV3|nr:hypothetical protein TVAGG3_0180070 [Trichomonas vaginalis G3]EAX97148.1 hypothetical protein TVAG_469220 [Trichomonas vaginalis G3]KAI5549216.1 hypothetical protein TVAGG3_0180070 [Trichomonas vaginalis G3]|eukprot:XP_001310078.1 hypothetical protein [Trichomonas vaginalis G3]
MNDAIKSLKDLAEKKNLFPAERIICTNVINLEKSMKDSLTEENSKDSINALQSVLEINSGNLSLQLSCRIEHGMALITSKFPQINLDEIIKSFIAKPTPAKVYVIGMLFYENAAKCIDIIPDLMKIKMEEKHPIFYAIETIFAKNLPGLEPFIKNVLEYLKQNSNTTNEAAQFYMVQLMMKIIRIKQDTENELVEIAKIIMNNATSRFVIDYICRLLAFIGCSSLRGGTKPESMKHALYFICIFPNYIHKTFGHFFHCLNIEYIQYHIETLTNFVIDYCPSQFPLLTCVLMPEHRKSLYTFFENNENFRTNLEIFDTLAWDEQTSFNVAGFAFDMVSSKDEAQRIKGSNYFTTLYSRNHDLAYRFLQHSLLFLEMPPEGLPHLNKNIIGKALVAANIISSTDIKDNIIRGSEERITAFLNRALDETEIFDAEFSAAFILLSSLPERIIPFDLVFDALKRFRQLFKDTPFTTPKMKKKSKFVGETVAVFLAAHPYITKTDKTFELMLNNPDSFSSKVISLAAFLAFPKMQSAPSTLNRIANKLLPEIQSIRPNGDFIQYLVQKPMITKIGLIFGSQMKLPKWSSAFIYLNDEDFDIRISQNFSEFVNAIPKENVTFYISFLTKSEGQLATNIVLINNLLKDNVTAKFLPENTLDYLLDSISKFGTSRKVQIMSENVAMLLNHYNYLDYCLEQSQKLSQKHKCYLFSAIFSLTKTNLTNEKLYQMMMEMIASSKVKSNSPVALNALSYLFTEHFTEFTDQKFSFDQLIFLIDLMNTNLSLDPYILYHMHVFFTSLLHTCIASLKTNDEYLFSVRQILSLFSLTQIPFAHQIYYRTIRSVLSICPSLIDEYKDEYPHIGLMSVAQSLNACGLYSDLISLNKTPKKFELYLNRLPQILLLLQYSNDSRASDYVLSVAHLFTRLDFDVSKFNDFLNLIKKVLVEGIIPNIGHSLVGAKNEVKKCILEVLKILTKNLKFDQKEETWQRDITSCAINPIMNREQEHYPACFSVLLNVIEKFGIESIEKELAQAAARGFNCLDDSSTFLNKLLPLFFADSEKHFEYLKIYFNGIENMILMTPPFMQTFTLIVQNLQNEKVLAAIKSNIPKFVTFVKDFVATAMEIMDKNIDNNAQVGIFFTGWSNFLESCVLFQKYTNVEIIDNLSVISFCCDEITRCKNQWRVVGAVNGLKSVFNNFEISDQESISNLQDTLKSSESKLSEDDRNNLKKFI